MRVLTVSVGLATPIAIPNRGHVASAIVKTPFSTLANPRPVHVARLGLTGDEQADRSVHGGPAKAVYAYPREHYPIWETIRMQAGIPGALPHGWFGENLTIEGLTEPFVWIGDVLRIGEVELRVESPRSPCFKFDARMDFDQASKVMNQSGFTGFYCSVLRDGTLAAGDAMSLVAGERGRDVAGRRRARRQRCRSAPTQESVTLVIDFLL
jgi:MOSC domain-containing protein YiiM